MPSQLLLVRHGESTWNAERRLQGQADPALSPLGREQAQALAPLIARLAPQRTIASDLARARETAELLGHRDARLDPRWRELHMGEWQGRLADEVEAADDEAYAAWRAGRIGAPGGETFLEFGTRVHAAAEEALAGGERLLVVTHGGPIRAVLVTLLGMDRARLAAVGNCSLTIVEAGPAGPRLAAYNIGAAGPALVQPEA